jgi:hypothetical protein
MARFTAINARNAPATHIEFEATRAEIQAFVTDLQAEINANPNSTIFHLQVERSGGGSPPAGGTLPINRGDTATVTLHRFN